VHDNVCVFCCRFSSYILKHECDISVCVGCVYVYQFFLPYAVVFVGVRVHGVIVSIPAACPEIQILLYMGAYWVVHWNFWMRFTCFSYVVFRMSDGTNNKFTSNHFIQCRQLPSVSDLVAR
jgi:hypothetical protein